MRENPGNLLRVAAHPQGRLPNSPAALAAVLTGTLPSPQPDANAALVALLGPRGLSLTPMVAKAALLLVLIGSSRPAEDLTQDPSQDPSQGRDIRSVDADLEVPPMIVGEPAPGRRVKQVLPNYVQTAVHHALYLPTDWKPDQRYPVIVEYAGNGPYRSPFGDESTGRVEGSKLGYGLSAGKGYLWVCLPFLDAKGEANVTRWWGDAPKHDPEPTVTYCKQALPWICEHYGGDPNAIVLVGFSRGAIACNAIGLHDDEIAELWRGFVAFSHYDGVKESWPFAGADRSSARERLKRLDGRPQFICSESYPGHEPTVAVARQYLESTGVEGQWTYMSTGFRNHSDAWILRPSPAREHLRTWLSETLAGPKRPR